MISVAIARRALDADARFRHVSAIAAAPKRVMMIRVR